MNTYTKEMAEKNNALVYEGFVHNVGQFLRGVKTDHVIVRTTYCRGNDWYDVEFDANRAGFGVSRVTYEPYAEKYEYSTCYHFWRKN